MNTMAYYKDRSKANRGQPFEELLRFANERYKQKKVAVVNKQPTEFIPIRDARGKIVNVKVEHKATVDFLGRYKQYPIAIEAKHSSEQVIRYDAVQQHQADYMDAFIEEPGTIGMVVISFELKRYFAIPWVFWQAAYNARVRPGASRTARVTVEAFGQSWDVPLKNSVRADELNPLWEIPNHDLTYGLHYLKDAAHYVTPPMQHTKPTTGCKMEVET